MCNDCWATAKNAAMLAQSHLGDALKHFDAGRGVEEAPIYKPAVEAAHEAVTVVLAGPRGDELRATQADVDALKQAQAALVSMSLTSANEVRPYRDYSTAQGDLGGEVRKIEAIWAAAPAAHRAT